MSILENWQGCDCWSCKKECTRVPGWFDPAEATRAMDAGQTKRMSVVHEINLLNGRTIAMALVPSRVGFEGQEVRANAGRCTFLQKNGLCEIHNSGYKPIECRFGFACREGSGPHETEMWIKWNSPEGVAAVKRWREEIKK